MAVADFLPSRYYALTGAIAVTALASVAALFDWRWLFLAGAAGRLVANLYTFLKPGELLTNPKAHIVYEYYWPLATSKSFDPQPGDGHAGDAHVIAAREEPRMQLRREAMRV